MESAFPWTFNGAPAAGVREERMKDRDFRPDRESGMRAYFKMALLFRAQLVLKFGFRRNTARVDDQHIGARLCQTVGEDASASAGADYAELRAKRHRRVRAKRAKASLAKYR